MMFEVRTTLVQFLIVLYNLQLTQGCPLVCLNGGTIIGSCSSCKCAPQWTGYDCSNPCGGNVSSSTGYITSPGFPIGYKNYEKCRWIVDVPLNSTVILSFKSLNLEQSHDYVYVYKGVTDSKLVGAYHGHEIPYETIIEESFLIEFITDGSVTHRGFSLYWVTHQGHIPKFLDAKDGDHMHTTVVRENQITLRCNAVGIPKPNIVWRKDGFVVAESERTFVTQNRNDLVFSRVNETDAGWYTCEAGNYLGKIKRSYQLTVHVFPVIIQMPASIHFTTLVEDYQQAAFWCEVYGIPEPEVNWKRDGTAIERTNAYFRKGKRWLLIRYVTYADLGNYSCYANNSLGQAESISATLSAANETSSLDRPSFYDLRFYDSPIVTVFQQADVLIHCYFYCYPLDIAVYERGIFVNTSNDDRFNVYSNSYRGFRFRMLYVTKADVGIYEFRWNSTGISWFTVIDVQVPPITLITTKSGSLKSFYNKATISCQSETVNPNPAFNWYKNDVAINSSWDGYKISSDYFKSYLTLKYYPSHQYNDSYNCTAINVAGKSTASIRVTVQAFDGWVESNRGSQCSVSCGSKYGITVVQRRCSKNGVRCVGPSVYLQACRPPPCPTYETTEVTPTLTSNQNATPATYDSLVALNSSQPSVVVRILNPTHDSKQELSRGAVGGISVTVTAITAAVVCGIIVYFILNRARLKSSKGASESTTSSTLHTNMPFRRYPREHCDESSSREETTERNRQIYLPPVPRRVVSDSEHPEIDLEERYIDPSTTERMAANPAYATTRPVQDNVQDTHGTTYPIYEDATQH